LKANDVSGRPIHTRRVVVDGEPWVIREVPAPTFDRRGGTHLVFESEHVMRRLRTFPANWHELSDTRLFELSLDLR
jgi:hypothetical protein